MPIILQSKQENELAPLTENEQNLIHKLRAMLKDIPDEQYRSLNTLVEQRRGVRWSDELLLVYLQVAMADINSEPPLTVCTVQDCPISWHGCLLTGAFIMALLGEAVVQNGESFSYSDNGISLSINIAAGYQSIAQAMLQSYQQNKTNLKRALRPHVAAIKSSPLPVRIRSYAPRQWVWR